MLEEYPLVRVMLPRHIRTCPMKFQILSSLRQPAGLVSAAGLVFLLSAFSASAQPLGTFRLLERFAPHDINDGGLIVGRDGAAGFVMRNGVITRYVATPVVGRDSLFSQLYGVNNAGDMVGEYFAVGVPATGFMDRHGVLTIISFPDASAVRTIPHDINNQGHIAGFFQNNLSKTIGFLQRGGRFDKIEIAGARFVTILGMNDSDQLVGHYTLESDPDSIRHGFMWSQGQFTAIAFQEATHTEPSGIADDGTIVGTYSKTVNGTVKRFAFVLRNGVFKTIGVPGVLNNSAAAINTQGVIVGDYFSLEVDFFTGQIIDATTVGWVLTP
jgi:uncharacterized membrane protein